MKIRRFVKIPLLLFFQIFGSGTSSGQEPPSKTTSSTDTSAQALQYIQQSLLSAGWNRDWTSMTLSVSGTLVIGSNDTDAKETLQLTAEYSGNKKVKVVVNGMKSATQILNGDDMQTTSSDGSKLEASRGAFEASAFFPFLTDLVRTSDSKLTYKFIGKEDVSGISALKVSIHRNPPQGEPAIPDTLVWLDSNTMLPIQSDTARRSIGYSAFYVVMRRQYSNYKAINGILIPLTIEESVSGKQVSSLTISSAQFGTAIPDSEFQITQ